MSVEGCHAEAEHLSGNLPSVEAEGAADGRVIDVNQLHVETDVSAVPRIVVSAGDEFFGGVSVLGEDVGGGAVEFKSLLNDHVSELDVETCVADGSHGERAGGLEVVESTIVALALQPEAVVLHSGGRGEEFVVYVGHGDSVGEGVGIEYVEAVADAQGGVARWAAERRL